MFTCLFLFISNLSVAQERAYNDTFDLLLGSWKLDYPNTLKAIKQESKSYYKSLKAEKQEAIKKGIGARRLTFSKDGTYIIRIDSEHSQEGTWELLADRVTLLIYLDGHEFNQQVMEIDETSMTLNLGENTSDVNRLMDTWYLKKQNKQ
ncbi:hypothetical protein [Formosa haliotis]|uniref:hypothetical protein n=1 Tax=Formosa haliotis TaxID=1555194 RepID=UPI00114739B9|nr:hypothetical protein [Formosa haliotis]